MDLFSSKVRTIGVLAVILIVIFSFGIFYFIQNITENNVRSSLIKEQVDRQLTSTMAISQHIGSDLSLVMAVLDGLGNSAYLQNEELSAEKTKNLIEEKYGLVKNIVDRIFVLGQKRCCDYRPISRGDRSLSWCRFLSERLGTRS